VPAAIDGLALSAQFTLRVCDLLRQRGVDVGTQQSITCLKAIVLHDVLDEHDLKRIYRLTLINRKQDLWALHLAFEDALVDFLRPPKDSESKPTEAQQPRSTEKGPQIADDHPSTLSGLTSAAVQGYSVREVDRLMDFRFLPKTEWSAVLAELAKIAKRHATIARRNFKRSNKHRGRIDLRTLVRQALKFDGEVLNWRFKRRRPSRSRFVVIADVSGSMEVYSRFLLNFIHQLNAMRQIKVESFVFSTRLERLTREFKMRNFHEMLNKVALMFSAWSGGTKIGAAIEALNEVYRTLVTPKTCVIIMSDGWDTGDIALLGREMEMLQRRAKSVIWINPLKGDPGYQPLAQGMAAAAPYCDRVIAGHSIESLETLAGVLSLNDQRSPLLRAWRRKPA
jgi:uncharacterized protein with von Willebrand factor type A (vWA) domain